jgi:hypothetical protein
LLLAVRSSDVNKVTAIRLPILTSGLGPFQYALTQCRVIFIYVRLFLLPTGQNGDWGLRLASFGLLILILMRAPSSSIVPLVDALAERRMYLPIMGLILAFIALVTALCLKAGSRRTIAIVAVLCAAILSWHRSAVWVSDDAFWTDVAEKNRANMRARNGLATALMARGNCVSAARQFAVARSESPISNL